MTTPIQTLIANAEPVKSLYQEERIGDCTIYRNQEGKEVARRYFSTSDTAKIKAAMLLLLETDWGFAVSIVGPAFKEPNCSKKNSTLEIRRTGYGYSWTGPEDIWHVIYNGKELSSHKNPHDAINAFLQVREEKELGEDMAERNFAGHASPPGAWLCDEEDGPNGEIYY